jgi:hypothetical protein
MNRYKKQASRELKEGIAIVLSGLIGLIPAGCFYILWAHCMSLIPAAAAWAGLAKIGVTLALLMFGLGITLASCFLLFAFCLTIAAAIID